VCFGRWGGGWLVFLGRGVGGGGTLTSGVASYPLTPSSKWCPGEGVAWEGGGDLMSTFMHIFPYSAAQLAANDSTSDC
jgi:hypothetical protein